MIINGTIITADADKWITNGVVYAKQVTLGIYDSQDNWSQVDEIPEPIIESLEEELNIDSSVDISADESITE